MQIPWDCCLNSALAPARYSGRLRPGGVASNASDSQSSRGNWCPAKCAAATVETQSEVSPVGPVGLGPGTSEGSARQSAVLALLPLVGCSLFEWAEEGERGRESERGCIMGQTQTQTLCWDSVLDMYTTDSCRSFELCDQSKNRWRLLRHCCGFTLSWSDLKFPHQLSSTMKWCSATVNDKPCTAKQKGYKEVQCRAWSATAA